MDAPQLENALLNLCINARDAMPDGGKLTIETANKWLDERAAAERELPPGQYVSLCVSDTGIGMAPDVVAHAFDPFFTTKPMGQGTGLGLSMIYGFARQSGGQIRIYTEVGKGTTMCLYLPRHLGPLAESGVVGVRADRSRCRRNGFDCGRRSHRAHAGDRSADGKRLQCSRSRERAFRHESHRSQPGYRPADNRCRPARRDEWAPVGRGRPHATKDIKVLFITGFAENAAVSSGHLDNGMEILTKPFAMWALANKVRKILEA